MTLLTRLVLVVVVLAVTALAAPARSMCKNIDGEQMAMQVALEGVYHRGFNYTCEECFKMIESLEWYCKDNGASSFDSIDGFVRKCHDRTIFVTNDYEILDQKCLGFHNFVTDIYCPLDPCVQITNSMNKAPHAVCHLLKCQGPSPMAKNIPQSVSVPLACPAYVQDLIDKCARRTDRTGLNTHDCDSYARMYQREGCEMVVNAVINATLPTEFCSTMNCEELARSSLSQYCENVLHLPALNPVPVPDYLAWLVLMKGGECQPVPGYGIHIISGTFGRNCSGNYTDNIKQSLVDHCEGRVQCTYGNQNMVNSSSAWDPMRNDSSPDCRREFEIKYTCKRGGPVHTIVAPEETKFMNKPFSCILEMPTEKELHDMELSEKNRAQPRIVAAF